MPQGTKKKVVCCTAIFSVVTQHWGGALRHDTKNSCVADLEERRGKVLENSLQALV